MSVFCFDPKAKGFKLILSGFQPKTDDKVHVEYVPFSKALYIGDDKNEKKFMIIIKNFMDVERIHISPEFLNLMFSEKNSDLDTFPDYYFYEIRLIVKKKISRYTYNNACPTYICEVEVR